MVFVGPYRMECGLAAHQEGIERYLNYKVVVLSEYLFGNRTDTGQGGREYIRCFRRGGSLERLTKLTLDQNPALIHIQHESGLFKNNIKFMEYLKVIRAHGIQIIITIHTITDLEFIKEIGELSTRLIFNTRMQLEIANKYCYSRKYVHIPVGIPEPNIMDKYRARKLINIPGNVILIISTGFICPTKNILRNIDVISKLDNVYYLIVGMPQVQDFDMSNKYYFDNVRRSIRNYKNIRMDRGYFSLMDLGKYYSASDIILCNYDLVSSPSGTGNALMGMGYGVPLICSRSRLLDDIDNGTCLRIECNDDRGLRHAIRGLIKDRALHKVLSDACINNYNRQSWERISKIHENLYKSLMLEKHNKLGSG